MSEGLGYVIELGGDAAGLVVKEHNRFRFYAAEKRFAGLERKLYRSPAEAENACRKVERAAHRARTQQHHVPFDWPILAV
jgi:hypothetical protein